MQLASADVTDPCGVAHEVRLACGWCRKDETREILDFVWSVELRGEPDPAGLPQHPDVWPWTRPVCVVGVGRAGSYNGHEQGQDQVLSGSRGYG